MAGILLSIMYYILILVISAVPLWLAVKMMGGEASILKVILVNFFVAIAAYFLTVFLRFGTIIAFIALLVIYHLMFGLGWIRSLVAWLVQFVIAFILILIFAYFGISLVLF